MDSPNSVAYFALFFWPFVTLLLFAKFRPNCAMFWTIMGAQLLLPVGAGVKLPMIPALDKVTLAAIPACVCCAILGERVSRPQGRIRLIGVLIVVYFLSPITTSLLNGDSIVRMGFVIQGIGLYDAASALISQLIFFSPFLLARKYFRSSEDSAMMPKGFAAAGLVYSVPMLFEVRFSPQLHNWIYGYHPHDFSQQMRAGGFRPVVFMGHGLWVAIFAATAVLASMSLWRAKTYVARIPPAFGTVYLIVVLVLCKSAGVLFYTAVLAPVIRYASPRAQVSLSALVVVISLAYPILRSVDVFPTSNLVEIAASFSEDRAGSLAFRFENEDKLVSHALDRFWFGWGRYGRSRVYDEETGKDLTVTDGRWVITMGQFGFIGFLAEFGLLAIPVISVAAVIRRVPTQRDAIDLAALSLILAMTIVDQLPNATMGPWTWLLAGSLVGRAESLLAAKQRAQAPQPRAEIQYGLR